ncbi:hypothetical protein [Enterococcus casseliflavus]
MDIDELIYTLYKLAKETDDEELQGWLLDVGFLVKKNGIRGLVDDPNIDPEDEIHFDDLISKLQAMSDIAKNKLDKMKVDDLRNTLVSDGIDGTVG